MAVVGYRSVAEAICKERGARGKSLHAMFGDLARLRVPQPVIDGFHEARLLGNDSVRDGLEYAPDEIADVADLIKVAVLVLCVQPAERQRMAEARLARRTAHKAEAVNPPPSTPWPRAGRRRRAPAGPGVEGAGWSAGTLLQAVLPYLACPCTVSLFAAAERR
ncbi:DUF4145 domain-containing protein [Streptomyces olivaceoviridis]|uniref:DUF4145 domain-containing protein n=1 Tax=Streptomyces olivaceoviridis TaxID=1921 RepID=UPI00227D7B04|nr:DUF4145 domain-containing protein [Streptomyces olivaceoviridis]